MVPAPRRADTRSLVANTTGTVPLSPRWPQCRASMPSANASKSTRLVKPTSSAAPSDITAEIRRSRLTYHLTSSKRSIRGGLKDRHKTTFSPYHFRQCDVIAYCEARPCQARKSMRCETVEMFLETYLCSKKEKKSKNDLKDNVLSTDRLVPSTMIATIRTRKSHKKV